MEELNPGGGARIHGPPRSSELIGTVRALPAAGAVAEYRHRAIKPILRDGLGQRVYDLLPYSLEHSGGQREELTPESSRIGRASQWSTQAHLYSVSLKRNQAPSASYRSKGSVIAMKRAALSGYRLALMLEEAFGQ